MEQALHVGKFSKTIKDTRDIHIGLYFLMARFAFKTYQTGNHWDRKLTFKL